MCNRISLQLWKALNFKNELFPPFLHQPYLTLAKAMHQLSPVQDVAKYGLEREGVVLGTASNDDIYEYTNCWILISSKTYINNNQL